MKDLRSHYQALLDSPERLGELLAALEEEIREARR